MREIRNSTVMGFVRIAETYPNDYTLVRIDEIDHRKGTETGTAIFASPSRGELELFARDEGIITETIFLIGVNLMPVFGGFL